MTAQPEILRVLPDGLVLRRSTAADAEKLAAFNIFIHSDTDIPDERIGAWTRDLLSGDHPTFAVDDFTLVEDPQTGKVISSLNLISQTWTYAGIPFKVGRPELVGTDPHYRERGLVRAQFEVIHAWSRQRGELLQGITGIPYYYRQFGYEMAVNLGGGRIGSGLEVPPLEKDRPEPFQIRLAREADLGFIARLYQENNARSLLAVEWNDALWRYELLGKSRENINRFELRMIETPSGEPLGFFAHPVYLWDDTLPLVWYELKPGAAWHAVTPSVIRALWQIGEECARHENKPLKYFSFRLHADHPAFQVAARYLPKMVRAYTWYLRTPDLRAFLERIAPALEARLAASAWAGYSGELTLGFYRSGVNLKFQNGHLAVENWHPTLKEAGKAVYPDQTFLQLLFGHRTQAELEYAFRDCSAEDAVKPLLEVLFPKQASDLWPIQ